MMNLHLMFSLNQLSTKFKELMRSLNGVCSLRLKYVSFFKKMGQSRSLFAYFRYFLDTISIIQIKKSIDGVLGSKPGAAGW